MRFFLRIWIFSVYEILFTESNKNNFNHNVHILKAQYKIETTYC